MDAKLKTRLVLACTFVVALLCVLSGRLIWIELVRAEDLSAQARARYEDEMVLPAPRGRIYDRNGDLLARNQTVYTLKVDCLHLRDPGLACIGLAKKENKSALAIKRAYLPSEIQSRYREYVVESLAPVLRIPRHRLGRILNEKKSGEIILAKDLEDDFATELRDLFDKKSIEGLYLEKGQRRYYPSPLSLTHVIGYVNSDGVGEEGIERVFDEEMTGVEGMHYCERDRRRREIHAYRGKHVDPIAGKDVHLTIDMGLQAILEKELDSVVETFTPEKVSSVWMRPGTGEILAIASRPHFDLETRKGFRRNIAISDLYQPGSTFKIVGYAGAFDRGLITPSDPIDCHMGEYTLEGFTMKDHHPYGTLSAETAFAKSSNIGAYLVTRPLNKHVFHYYMDQFGFGRKSGIQLTAENSGLNPPVKGWTMTSFSSKAIGYEVAVTPLQMAAACNVIASGGMYYTPTVVRGVTDPANGEMKELASPDRRRVVSETAANHVRRCMQAVMQEGGTGTKAAIPGYSLAGKTGTARKHVENVGYVPHRYVVSFMGFFPAENPELLGLVVIDDPHADDLHLYGGTIAAPVFKEIAEKAIRLYGIAPDRPEELLPKEEEGVELSQNANESGVPANQ